MKIIKIKSKNINSLKGESEVDFTQPYFQDKIFAIVGQTGAGKSTLLDIITLALYAQTTRLEKSISHVISEGSNESFCEVTFELNNKTYQSRLEQEKQGEQIVQEMYLFESHNLITKGVDLVCQEIVSLTGLDFNSFSQSIVLPQGLFNQFLTASTHQRTALLEKITDTKLYAKISKEVYRKSNQEIKKQQEMEQNFKILRHLNPEKRQDLEKRLKEIEEEKKRYNLEKILHQISQKKEFEEDTATLDKQKIELEKLQKTLINKQFEEKEYHDYIQFSVQEKKKIEQSKLLDHELEFSQKNLKSIQAEIKTIERELEQIERSIQESESKLSQLHIKETLLKKELENFENITHLQQNYTLIQSKFNERIRYQNELQNLTQIEEKLSEKPLSTEITMLEKRAVALEREIKAQNIEKVEQQNLILEKQIAKLAQKEQLEQKKSSLIQSQKELQSNIETIQRQNRTLQEQERQLDQVIQQLEEKKILEEKIINYEEDRAKLKKGDPCPLCGATEHPLFKEKVEPNKTTQLLEEQKKLKEKLQTQRHQGEKELVKNETEIAQINEKIKQQAHELVSLQHLKGDIHQLREEQQRLQKELQAVNQQRNELKFVKEKIVKAKEELLELKIRIQKNNNRKKIEEDLQLKIQELSYYLIKTLRLYGITLDPHSITLLEQQRDAYQKLSLELKQLQQALHPIEGAKIESQSQKNYIEERLLSLKKRASMQECDILLVKQNRFSILENKDTLQYAQELEHQSKIKQENHNQFMQLKELFSRQKSSYFSTVERLEKQQKLKLLNLETLELERDKVKQKLENINQELGAIKNQLEQDDEYIQREEKGLNNLEEQKRIVKEWRQLNELIGSADGSKYQRYAQLRTLRNLVELANRHLKKLNHRYLINIKEDNSLELEIVDLYLANAKRTIATLSGGESFILSLALSLALIDLNSQELEINTLFLDEGFETLDDESLQEVLQVLSSLECQGKIIGIISHTPLLKEQIKTQIIIEKKGDGISSLSINQDLCLDAG